MAKKRRDISITDAIKEEPQRFIENAFHKNKKIKDYSDFVSAIEDYMEFKHGDIKEESYKFLYEHPRIKEIQKENLSEKEYNEMLQEEEKGEKIWEIIKDDKKPKTIAIEKGITIKSYNRSGVRIKGYSKGYNNWTYAQRIFIQHKKVQGLKPKQIIYDYNQHFYQNPRSSSSVKTEIYRL